MRNPRLFLGILPLTFLLGAIGLGSVACSGSGGSSSAGDCFDYSTFTASTTPVSFQNDVLPIFRNSCGLSSSCHGDANPPAPGQHYYGPPLSMGTLTTAEIAMIWSASVGVQSVDEPDMKVIDPSHPETSFMMYKLDGDPNNPDSVNCSKLQCAADQTCLGAMPQTGDTLPIATRNTIRAWIAQGALNN